jgi:hypothetical protein
LGAIKSDSLVAVFSFVYIYANQLGQYLQLLGACRGAIVYMTSGHIDWVTAPPQRGN